jgi:hypothetical protein
MGGRGKEGEPIEWTGWACCLKCVTEANPGRIQHDSSTELPQGGGSHRPLRRREKPLARVMIRPYRKPTLVGKEQSPQVIERPSVKELGKLTPYLWKKGGLSTFALRSGGRRLQEIGSTDCLPKT